MAYGFISDYETLKPRQSTCDVALAWLLYQFDLPIVLGISVAPSILLTIAKTAKEVTECMAGIKATASIPRTPMYEVTPWTQASVGKHWLRKVGPMRQVIHRLLVLVPCSLCYWWVIQIYFSNVDTVTLFSWKLLSTMIYTLDSRWECWRGILPMGMLKSNSNKCLWEGQLGREELRSMD